jgi:hypothetical protein
VMYLRQVSASVLIVLASNAIALAPVWSRRLG